MSILQESLTDITVDQFPGYINVSRNADDVTVTIRSAPKGDQEAATATRQFTRSEAIGFFASVLQVLA